MVAYDLSPSDTANMHKKNVAGFITDIGGRTSHTAIMAKSLEIPAVVGLEKATARIKTGDILIVDGADGIVIINPDNAVLKKYELKQQNFVEFEKALLDLKDTPATTIDGHQIKVSANI